MNLVAAGVNRSMRISAGQGSVPPEVGGYLSRTPRTPNVGGTVATRFLVLMRLIIGLRLSMNHRMRSDKFVLHMQHGTVRLGPWSQYMRKNERRLSMNRRLVAQVGNLPCRRLSIGGAGNSMGR